MSPKAKDAAPKVGTQYKIAHSRKGTFEGIVRSIDGEWAEIEITGGEATFLTNANAVAGDRISARLSLCTFTPAEPA